VLPILLAELMLRRVARDHWLGKRGIIICVVLLTVTAASGFAPVADRQLKLIVLLGVATLIALARAVPRADPRPGSTGTAPGLAGPRLAGALGIIGYFAVLPAQPRMRSARYRLPGRGRNRTPRPCRRRRAACRALAPDRGRARTVGREASPSPGPARCPESSSVSSWHPVP